MVGYAKAAQVRWIAGSGPLLSGLRIFCAAWPDRGLTHAVMAVLVTAIHAFRAAEGVDARDEREHDGESVGRGWLAPNPDSMDQVRQ